MQTNFPYNLNQLENGLRLLTVPMTNSDSVTVLVLVGTGSRYETKEINGISHFLEHMMFKGTAKRPGSMDISHELESIGADYNAFTDKEQTGYYAKAASGNLDLILDVISDIFQNSKIDAGELEKERGVIIEEMNMVKDDPRRYAADLFGNLLYGDQPLGWDIIGTKDVIRGLPRDRFVDYFNTHYFAKNTVIAVAGKIDEAEVKQKVEKYFSNVRQHEFIEPLAVVEEQKEPAIKIFNKDTDQTHLYLGLRAFDRFDERLYPLRVLSVIMGAGMSSRLFTEVREKRGLAYYAYSSSDSYADAGSYAAMAGVNNEKLEEALKVILHEFKRITDEPVPEKELAKAKSFIHGSTVIGLETSDSLASFYANQELLKREIKTVEQIFEKIDSVTVDDVQKIAKEIFKKEHLNLAIVGPVKDKEDSLVKLLEL